MRKKISVLLMMSMLIQLFIGVAPILAEDSNGMNAEPEFVSQLTVTLSPGVATGSTSATVTNCVYGSLIVNVTEQEITTPQVGEIAPTAGSNLIVNYESGADITAGVVAGNYLQIYDIDMDEEGRIAAFYQVELTEVDIEDGIIGDIEDENMIVGIDEEEEKAEDMVMNSIAPMSSGDILGTYELGVNVTGTLYADGKFVISGTGGMNSYNSLYLSIQSQITSVEIESGITNIGAWMFDGCKNLKSVTIPNSVTSIGEYAFHYCSGLTSITFAEQSQITSIGEFAFYNCSGLTSVALSRQEDRALLESNLSAWRGSAGDRG
ncbi:MAG: leucine-rich repeat protein [Desulfitobacteriaceae bacterium]|nr:leucine-rich repeat protein [Desulfitobacteriaceae bacterium]